ncbi:acetyltransferase [Brumimicrobium aurantiacum]|uniref:PglD N-terminal domain-containing protein n=1 Tax=Brumimicrobium aurantiacum TaxID=1737063 RepID=A0A3E1F1Z8_9FLAO|nr:acetyltransferase [Brumimicrobium aurantiacum]RFC55737.1 hypothetical protein DXU93_02025 [Brumimicrobium aurantiacum]
MKTLAIIGAGDLGLQIAHYAIEDKHYSKVVFFDDLSKTSHIKSFQILGETADIIQQFNLAAFDELIIGIGYKHLNARERFFNEFKGIIPFGKIIHSTSWVDKSAHISEGCVIYPSCSIDINVHIDQNTIINNSCSVAHDSYIGKHSFLSPRIAIAGFVKIGEKCILGINSTIIDNINIAEQIQIGGGTVVINDLEKKGLYVGNPQRFIN